MKEANPGKASYDLGQGRASHLQAALLMEKYGVQAQDDAVQAGAGDEYDDGRGGLLRAGLERSDAEVKAGNSRSS